MGHVVILGVFVADTAYRAERMPIIGETVLGNSFSLGPGGKGSNQAVAAGRLGVKVWIMKGEVYGKRELSPLVGLSLVSNKKKNNKPYHI